MRSTGIGASEAAAILGVSPWKGALQLFHEKRGTAPPSEGEEFARKLGLALEDPIAVLYAEETKRTVTRPPAGQFELRRHRRKPFMVATLDGRVYFEPVASGPLEIKTAAISKAAAWRDEAPIDYQVQVQHQLAVTDDEKGAIAALIGGVYLKHADIQRDQEFIDLLESACEEFWRRVELNDPPPADGTEATKEFLKKLYANPSPTTATLPPEAVDWDTERLAAIRDLKAAEERKTAAENKIKAAIGENVQGVLPNNVVYTWKLVDRKGYTVAPTAYRDFRRREPQAGKTRPKNAPPKLRMDVGDVYREEKEAEDRVAEDFEF